MTRTLFLGLLLLAGSGAFTALAIVGNLSGGPAYTVSVLNHHIATMNGLALFGSGLALALVFCLGPAMTTAGGTRRHRHRRQGSLGAQDAGHHTGRDDRVGGTGGAGLTAGDRAAHGASKLLGPLCRPHRGFRGRLRIAPRFRSLPRLVGRRLKGQQDSAPCLGHDG
ncbi:hypothetical protein [Streptomyces sp. NPDC004546]|uniref:hypothetical protein n=1 Tax=Streptomyces sp. NPDC004546 TaxID=3154282 RepID=UPI0033B0FCA1